MPPRYAYWTILIDGKATAFRARDREELLPTFNQLARKNTDIVMRYFSRGRLWDSPEQAQWASRNAPTKRHDQQRGRDWRPGGEHHDPRAQFMKPAKRRQQQARAPSEAPAQSERRTFERSFRPKIDHRREDRGASGAREPQRPREPKSSRPYGKFPRRGKPFDRPPRKPR